MDKIQNVFNLPHNQSIQFNAGEVANALGGAYQQGYVKGYAGGLVKGAIITSSAIVIGITAGVILDAYTSRKKAKQK